MGSMMHLLLFLTALLSTLPAFQSQIVPVSSSTVYRASYSAAPSKISFTPASPALTLSDDAVDVGVPIGFSFVFYNVSYTAVNLAPNGNIQFSTTASTYSPGLFGAGDANLAPFIAFFFTDLYPTSAGQRTYATLGTAPNRQFILRYTAVGYCCSVVDGQGLSADVLLYEGSNNIEFRYYDFFVDNIHAVDIGIENSMAADGSYDVVAIINDLTFNSTLAAVLNNTAYTFTPIVPFVNPRVYSVVSVVDTFSTIYTGSIQTAPALQSFSPAGTLPSVDNTVVNVNLGFDFPFYNWTYSSVYISENGNIQFQSGSTTAYPSEWGINNAPLTPFIAFFFTDLYSVTGSRTYATVGSAPNRYFILRLTGIPYQSYIGDVNQTSSIDVLLYENGHIEMRYNAVGAMSSQYYYTNIGVQNAARDDASFDYLSVFNYKNVGTFTASQLVGKSILITPRSPLVNLPRYTGPQAPVPVSTNSAVYSASEAASAPAPETFTPRGTLPNVENSVNRVFIGFNFTFYNVNYQFAYVSSKGNIQFQSADISAYPYSFGSNNAALTPFIAFFWANLLPTSGSRTYATVGDAPNRYFILRIADCPVTDWSGVGNLTMDVLLYENNSSIAFRYYQVPALNEYYFVDVGVQNVVSNNTYDYVSILNMVNLNALTSQPLVGKSYMISPRSPFTNPQPFAFIIQPQSSSTIYTATVTQGVVPPVSFTPVSSPALPQTDNDVTMVPIGFTFVFYGIAYTNVFIGANGDLQFQTANAYSYPSEFGSGNAQLAPVIAFFYSDLMPADPSSIRQYGVTGTAPNRQFVLRYSNVALQSWISSDRLSVDVILFETTNRIELRFYAIPVFSQYYQCAIGIENVANTTGDYDWIAVVNSKTVSPIVALSLNQTTYSFTPSVPFVNAPAFAPVRPTVTTSTISTYTVTSRTTVPDRITFTPSSPPLPLDDNAATRVSIGFNFTFYGYQYDRVFIASNGNLQFRTGSTSAYPSTFPSTDASALWPYIAYYFADLAPTNVSFITYGVTGSAPNRQFVVRYQNVPFSYAGTMAAVDGDVILYETSNNVEFRYYSTSPTPYTYDYVSIGMANAVGDYVSVVNYLSLNGAQALGLTGTSYLIAPTTPFVNPPFWGTQPLTVVSNSVYYNGSIFANVGPRLSFTPTALTVADDAVTTVSLGFNFVFFNRSYSSVVLSTNGNMQFATSSTSWSPGLFGSGVESLTPFIAAFFTDLWPGVANMTSYGRLGTAPNRQFVYRFNDVYYCCSQLVGRGLQADIVLFETTNVIEIRYWNVPVDNSHLIDIGIENSAVNGVYDYLFVFNDVILDAISAEKLNGSTIRYTPIQSGSTTPVVSPANAPQPVSFSTVYNTTVSLAPAKVALSNPTTIPVNDDGVTSGVQIGFAFNFYNVSYTALNIGANGNIQFQTSMTSWSPGLFGAGDASLSPFIAFFYTDLYPETLGDRVYSTIGSAPNRQFILRLTNVSYCCTVVQNSGLSADVVLYETSNTVEIRFYQVLQSGSRNVVVGIENVVSEGVYDYIAIVNDVVISQTVANSMQGISYTFTPIRPFTGGALTFPINPIYNATNYQVTMTPAPAQIALPGAVNMTEGDDSVDTLPLGFNFVFYNRSYSSVSISANGNIQFETQSSSYQPNAFGSSSSDLTPFIAFFYADLYPNFAGARSTAVVGTAPNRQFVLRMSDVFYCCQQSIGQGLNMDVILSETSNTIDMRFYRIPLDGSHYVDIGIESSTPGYAEWVSIWNDRVFDSNYANTLTGQQVRFAPTYNTPVPVPSSSSTGVPAVSSSPSARSSSSSSAVPSSTASASSTPIVPSSTSAPVQPTSAPVVSSSIPTPATSSARPSSSVAPAQSSSSSQSVPAPSSTSTPVTPAESSSTGSDGVVDDSSSSSSSGLSGGAIAGIVIGVIVGVIILLIIAFCLLFKNTGSKFTPHTDAGESEASHVAGSEAEEAHEAGEVEMESV